MDTVTLGATGISVSRLCIGTGTDGWNHRSRQSNLGVKGLARLLRFAYDQGITFWDSADMYGTHPHVAEALRGLDRSSVVITTKTVSRKPDAAIHDVERFLRELQTDYLDILLLHCLMETDWPERYGATMEALFRLKERGLIRALGVSCHDFGAFTTTAVTPWVEVVLARINYAGISMDAPPPRVIPVLDRMHASGKGIYGMKVMGAGQLGRDPEKAIRYVMGLPSVDAFTIGMTSEREVVDNTGIIRMILGERFARRA
jgi:aryl-alcohol dehydrogenase-like predicted oxidoreductase